MDRIFAIAALATFIGFLAAIAFFVPDLDLIIVFAVVILMAIWDFWGTIGPGQETNNKGS